ncbi:metallophosphoesterase [Desertibacillus haloalkaliphilus]|uniref:metallophosphoesterase n=1 Tax=Desertibacillus haloalkaliphilus TaxID=1328930 RepID=UPI001C26A768|nr:metallophosphoesterase [Desertibacillus haloalkaliphilus]MBU8906826.1 metallophosphoesterase [Desertibacillus haloalkaliphilus]
MKRKVKRFGFVALFSLIGLIVFVYVQNNLIVITGYEVRSERVPESFSGWTIVQLSDLHSKSFGDNQRTLVKKVKAEQPDLIVFTGDLVDSRTYHEDRSLTLMQQLVEVAPVYYVTGNHEWRSGHFDLLEQKLIEAGVGVLRDSSIELSKGNEQIQLVGIDDPARTHGQDDEMVDQTITEALADGRGETDYKVLLSHRPELLSLYSQFDIDLVFSGHAHGGQFRIPLIGGLVAPNQGLFPTYDSGKHTLGETTMIVNRGLGNSIIPVRLFNRPEIVVVTLESGKRP